MMIIPETATPCGLRLRAEMLRDRMNDAGSAARHVELAASRIERLEHVNAEVAQLLRDIRQELWIDHCLAIGRTDIDPTAFNSRPHIRLIDEALAKGGGE